MELLQQLNSVQHKAVTTIDGPVLVIAGAGSGKTRVIEYRVYNLVRHKINPNSILLLTFTRRAAREMLSRAAKHDPRCSDVEGGTFHSFAYKTLRRYARSIGFDDSFSILDEADAEEAVHKSATKLNLFGKERRFPKKDTLRNVISMSVNKQIGVEEVLKKEYPHFLEYAGEIDRLRKQYAAYKIEANYLDYDDLLLYLRLLLEHEEIRTRLSQKFRYIMVDEYQDTNALQGDITYLLGQAHGNIMVVGDDAQSIYGFRGSSHKNIMRFPERFPQCAIITLEENYRSTQSILDVANQTLENMKEKYSKCLVAARDQAGTKPRLMYFKDMYDEAEWVAGSIKEFHDEGVPLGQQAVLFRSSYISIPLQAALAKRNIPYLMYGGLKFYETAHVKDVISHLKLMINPKDELSWSRVLTLIDGIGPKISERLTEEIVACATLGDILTNVLRKYTTGHPFSEGLGRLTSVLSTAFNARNDVGTQFSVVMEYYEPSMKDRFDDWHLRLNDLETLRQIAADYSSLDQMLADFAIEPPERGVWHVDPSTPDEERPLTLSTIHSAKGLEWDRVFIVGLMDGVLPVSFALNDEEEIEEEHRLFYVAITRAKNHLFLSLHHEGSRGGITQFNKISRFVDAPNVLDKLEQEDVPHRQEGYGFRGEEDEEVVRLYDKRSLTKRISEFLK
jgi:DNA helicase-2/ATP-dependent DNA helicase PcrA